MEQSPCWGTNSCWTSQDITHLIRDAGYGVANQKQRFYNKIVRRTLFNILLIFYEALYSAKWMFKTLKLERRIVFTSVLLYPSNYNCLQQSATASLVWMMLGLWLQFHCSYMKWRHWGRLCLSIRMLYLRNYGTNFDEILYRGTYLNFILFSVGRMTPHQTLFVPSTTNRTVNRYLTQYKLWSSLRFTPCRWNILWYGSYLTT